MKEIFFSFYNDFLEVVVEKVVSEGREYVKTSINVLTASIDLIVERIAIPEGFHREHPQFWSVYKICPIEEFNGGEVYVKVSSFVEEILERAYKKEQKLKKEISIFEECFKEKFEVAKEVEKK